MAGLPKKYFKMFPGNLKRAWAKFKSDRGGSSGSAAPAKKKAKKSGGHSGTTNKGGKMAKSKAKAAFGSKPVQLVIFAGQAAAGGVATSFALNKTPKVKDISAGMKAGAQVALGLAGLFFLKPRWTKGFSAGSVIAGVFGGTKALLKLDPLAGPGALPRSEMNRLTNGRMGIPAEVRMGIPAKVRMGNSGGSGWGRGGWG